MSADDIPYDRSAPASGRLEPVSPLIRRIVRGNAGPFTFTGTCTYVIGHGAVAVVDPGPESDDGAEALVAALPGESVASIVVTHTHRDHSPGARRLQRITGAPIVGCGPHVAARAPRVDERTILDASSDPDHRPDRIMTDGEALAGAGYTLTAIETPGHTMNHLCFALAEEKALLSGDHVMAWSTTVVAPPDGSMSAYMASLDKLRGRSETVYWPGHGGPVRDPERFLRGLVGHRRMREGAIVAALGEGAMTIPDLVQRMYVGLDPRLHGAAALSVHAHLEDLMARGLAACDGEPALDGLYRAR
jgi:glyoxylase-like metal-dependent hydrolase (beta-lactamase superfamily II)